MSVSAPPPRVSRKPSLRSNSTSMWPSKPRASRTSTPGIIAELQRSDYYLFVDFRREILGSDHEARGSLFSHQELAIAYVSGFEHVLFFQERGMKLEGLMRYLGANSTPFDTVDQLVQSVTAAVRERAWRTDYSRHLIATRPWWSDGTICYGELTGRFLYIDIENKRRDLAAFDTVARLEFIQTSGYAKYQCPNRSHLKTTGQPGFSQIIWPCSHGAFDLLVVDQECPLHVYLNNALDVTPRVPVIEDRGRYALEYSVLAREFPVLRFTIDLELTGLLEGTTAALRETAR